MGPVQTATSGSLDTQAVAVRHDISLLTEDDLHLFNEGTHYRLHQKLGAHPIRREGVVGVYFALWAPNANSVHVIGDFNGWDKTSHPLRPRGSSGIWEGVIPGLGVGEVYKYHVVSNNFGFHADKADPLGFYHEMPPRTASRVWDLSHEWNDRDWMDQRHKHNDLHAPISIYEVHLGSWRRVIEDGFRSLSYREMAQQLAEHVKRTGFTHVELLPVMEHPFFGSWGYQCTGYFAPSSRYGTPQDLMALIDTLHEHGIGVILDWVPSHFPTDEHGLGYFDGTHLYEHADARQGFHQEWLSFIFNYDRHEVVSFLISSAMFWLEQYHADGLRVDGVASMLYLDYARREGEWIPNRYGGNENLGAIAFLRRLNEEIYRHHPDVQTYAEESTAWPMVARPTWVGGLGFGLKWDMGWMHDTLRYFSKDPIHRKYQHNDLTFRSLYAFSENFILPLSHDEVVHGKGSLLGKMPGDPWQKFANLRLLFAAMFAQPAKKLLFMGGEFGQWSEWNHDASLEWHLLEHDSHRQMMHLVGELNALYRREPALHRLDCHHEGFEWIDCQDTEESTLSMIRHSGGERLETIVVVFNFTPVPRTDYRVGVPAGGYWRELLNTDAESFGGSGHGNFGGVQADLIPWHGRPASLNLTLPPLGALFFKHEN